MKKRFYLAGAVIMLLAGACKDNKKVEKDSVTPIEIIRVDSYLMDNNVASLPDSMRDAEPFLDFIVNREVTGDSNVVAVYKSSKAFQVFASDVKERFTREDSIENVLGIIDSRLKSLLSNGKGLGNVYGIINPYNIPVVTNDSIVMIGLNHYLGVDYPGYAGFEEYRLRAKRAAHLPYDVAEARVVADYPYQAVGEPTLLNKMLYWGVIANIVEEVVPEANINEIFNLNDSEQEWLKNNSEKVWNQMIERQMIYSTNPDVADRLLYPAPKSFIINNDAPGMTGKYIGYLIVKSYLKNHPDVTLAEMLSRKIYNEENTLIASNFSGR